MVREFKGSDEGKHVMTADGDIVGTVESVEGSRLHIKPESDLAKTVRRKLGWTDEGEATYELRKRSIKEISDDGIHLKQNM
jgi:hypothetical protein